MPELTLDDTTLYYEDTGPGSTGQTVAFMHGLLWSTALFAPQIAALRGRYRCVAWDHRGQGRSAADYRHTIDIELVWQDAVQVLERLGGGAPVHVCGLSMGGFVAMRMGARRPDLVRSLALLETSSDPEPRENIGKYRLMSAVARTPARRALAPRIAPIMFGRTIVGDAARRAELDGYLHAMLSRRDSWRAVNGVIDRGGVHAELARIAAPTLVVVGDEDAATVPAKAERVAGAIRGARLVRIPRAGHSSTVEEPAAVSAALGEFFASC
jgi:pimeloyl-ACP methyl ester carboxylesterase|nr:alpha/beta fold hydrolase [Kofleriaceae bacterium]